MPIDFSKYQKKEVKILPEKQKLESKKIEDVPELEKPKLKRLEKERKEKNEKSLEASIEATKNPEKIKTFKLREADFENEIMLRIDQKINEIVNERILKLVKIGIVHELTMENMINFFKQTGKLKLYELKRFFSEASSNEIDGVLQYLYSSGILVRDKNKWYRLK